MTELPSLCLDCEGVVVACFRNRNNAASWKESHVPNGSLRVWTLKEPHPSLVQQVVTRNANSAIRKAR